MLNVPQDQHSAVFLGQRIQCLHERSTKFLLLQSLRRNVSPIGEILRHVVTLIILMLLLYGIVEVASVLAKLHLRFIDTDLDLPSAELRLSAETWGRLERFQAGFLHP